MDDLRERIINAHGGRARWCALVRLTATMSMGGAEFFTHLQPRPFRDTGVVIDARCFRVSFHPFPGRGQTGIFEPRRVRIEEPDGQVVADRYAPGQVARSLRHGLFWDDLDLLFVAGLSVWHAVMMPLLLVRSGATVERIDTLAGDDSRWARCEIELPTDVPLLARRQTVHVDDAGLIRRVDLFPVAYRLGLRVGKLLDGYKTVEGLALPTRQSVYPCVMNEQLWRAVRLVWLRLDDVSAVMGDSD